MKRKLLQQIAADIDHKDNEAKGLGSGKAGKEDKNCKKAREESRERRWVSWKGPAAGRAQFVPRDYSVQFHGRRRVPRILRNGSLRPERICAPWLLFKFLLPKLPQEKSRFLPAIFIIPSRASRKASTLLSLSYFVVFRTRDFVTCSFSRQSFKKVSSELRKICDDTQSNQGGCCWKLGGRGASETCDEKLIKRSKKKAARRRFWERAKKSSRKILLHLERELILQVFPFNSLGVSESGLVYISEKREHVATMLWRGLIESKLWEMMEGGNTMRERKKSVRIVRWHTSGAEWESRSRGRLEGSGLYTFSFELKPWFWDSTHRCPFLAHLLFYSPLFFALLQFRGREKKKKRERRKGKLKFYVDRNPPSFLSSRLQNFSYRAGINVTRGWIIVTFRFFTIGWLVTDPGCAERSDDFHYCVGVC